MVVYVLSSSACACYLQSTATHPALPDVFSFPAPALCRAVRLQESLYQVQKESYTSIEPWYSGGQFVILCEKGPCYDTAPVLLVQRSRIAEMVACTGKKGTSIPKTEDWCYAAKLFSGPRLFLRKTSLTFWSIYINRQVPSRASDGELWQGIYSSGGISADSTV